MKLKEKIQLKSIESIISEDKSKQTFIVNFTNKLQMKISNNNISENGVNLYVELKGEYSLGSKQLGYTYYASKLNEYSPIENSNTLPLEYVENILLSLYRIKINPQVLSNSDWNMQFKYMMKTIERLEKIYFKQLEDSFKKTEKNEVYIPLIRFDKKKK